MVRAKPTLMPAFFTSSSVKPRPMRSRKLCLRPPGRTSGCRLPAVGRGAMAAARTLRAWRRACERGVSVVHHAGTHARLRYLLLARLVQPQTHMASPILAEVDVRDLLVALLSLYADHVSVGGSREACAGAARGATEKSGEKKSEPRASRLTSSLARARARRPWHGAGARGARGAAGPSHGARGRGIVRARDDGAGARARHEADQWLGGGRADRTISAQRRVSEKLVRLGHLRLRDRSPRSVVSRVSLVRVLVCARVCVRVCWAASPGARPAFGQPSPRGRSVTAWPSAVST